MKETIFRANFLCNKTWLITGCGCNSYLLVGKKSGMLIDTGLATKNIRDFAQKLAKKPVTIAANTNGHFEHTGGNGYFEQVYMTARALETAKKPYVYLDSSQYMLDYSVIIVGDGDTIDLGSRVIEAIEMPTHKLGSVVFLDRKEKILFTGDEIYNMALLFENQEESSTIVEQYIKNMKHLLNYRNWFSYVCPGHGQVMLKASCITECLENAQIILSKEDEKSYEQI